MDEKVTKTLKETGGMDNLDKLYIEELNLCVKSIQIQSLLAEGKPFTNNNKHLRRLCHCLYKILILGLQNPTLGIWNVVKSFCPRDMKLKVEHMTNVSRSQMKKNFLKDSAWLCMVLNENLLLSFFESFAKNLPLLRRYYNSSSIILSGKREEMMWMIMELDSFQFDLQINSDCFDLPSHVGIAESELQQQHETTETLTAQTLHTIANAAQQTTNAIKTLISDDTSPLGGAHTHHRVFKPPTPPPKRDFGDVQVAADDEPIKVERFVKTTTTKPQRRRKKNEAKIATTSEEESIGSKAGSLTASESSSIFEVMTKGSRLVLMNETSSGDSFTMLPSTAPSGQPDTSDCTEESPSAAATDDDDRVCIMTSSSPPSVYDTADDDDDTSSEAVVVSSVEDDHSEDVEDDDDLVADGQVNQLLHDNSVRLYLMLNILVDDSETINQIVEIDEMNFLLFTNSFIYKLLTSSNEDEKKFKCQFHLPYENEYIKLLYDQQGIFLLSADQLSCFRCDFPNENIKKKILDQIQSSHLSSAITCEDHEESLREVVKAANLDEADLDFYTRVKYTSKTEKNDSLEGILQVSNGGGFFGEKWVKNYFVLEDGILYKYSTHKKKSKRPECFYIMKECRECIREEMKQVISMEFVEGESKAKQFLKIKLGNSQLVDEWFKSLMREINKLTPGSICTFLVVNHHLLLLHEIRPCNILLMNNCHLNQIRWSTSPCQQGEHQIHKYQAQFDDDTKWSFEFMLPHNSEKVALFESLLQP